MVFPLVALAAIVVVCIIVIAWQKNTSGSKDLTESEIMINRWKRHFAVRTLVDYVLTSESALEKSISISIADEFFPEDFESERIIFFDLLVMVYTLAGSADSISEEDAALLIAYCSGVGLKQLVQQDTNSEAIRLRALNFDPHEWKASALGFVSITDPFEAGMLASQYREIAKTLVLCVESIDDDRKPNLAIYEERIRRSTYDLFESIYELKGERSRDTDRDPDLIREKCVVLDLDEPFSADELKAAYRAKVNLWHPDRLQNMAPELQQMANEKLTAINEAYEVLCHVCHP